MQFTSELYNEDTFYKKFYKDLTNCKNELIIESPYITKKRINTLQENFLSLLKSRTKIYIITRDPSEHRSDMAIQSEKAIQWCESVGIQVLICKGSHHRKIAILDRKILWEGSLNVLSQTNSREIMRRIEGEPFANEMLKYLGISVFF